MAFLVLLGSAHPVLFSFGFEVHPFNFTWSYCFHSMCSSGIVIRVFSGVSLVLVTLRYVYCFLHLHLCRPLVFHRPPSVVCPHATCSFCIMLTLFEAILSVSRPVCPSSWPDLAYNIMSVFSGDWLAIACLCAVSCILELYGSVVTLAMTYIVHVQLSICSMVCTLRRV